MIVAQSQSGALRHARRQQIEYRINQLNSELLESACFSAES